MTFFSRTQSLSKGQSYRKQKGSGTSNWTLFRLQNKVRKMPLLVILTGQIWCYNTKRLLSYYKNYICKFMRANLWIHKLFHLHLSFWIWEVRKGREKITKIWISRELKELFRWNKKHFFIVFEGLSFGEKNKNFIKNSGHKL